MRGFQKYSGLFLLLFFFQTGNAQRQYAAHSVLQSGNWYKLAVTSSGVYKIDAALLRQLGISIPLPSPQIRLFGRSGRLPDEACSAFYEDDLTELALDIHDGGDGVFDAQDWCAFFCNGPNGWVADSVAQKFVYTNNIYSDAAYVYLNLDAAGKRIAHAPSFSGSTQTITDYQFRYHYEKDSYNLLSSGKEWYGERFLGEGSQPLTLSVNLPSAASHATIISSVAARSVGNSSSFLVAINGSGLLTHTIAPVTASNLDLFARDNQMEVSFNPAVTNQVSYRFQSANSSAIGWLNWLNCFAVCRLSMGEAPQLDFRSWAGMGNGEVAQYRLMATDDPVQIWRISDPLNPVRMRLQRIPGMVLFDDLHERPEEYIAFYENPARLASPLVIGKIANQDLHGLPVPQMIMVADRQLLPAAEQLADWHRLHDGLHCLVLSTNELYEEFSAGQPNPTAIRDMVKMFYDRAGQRPRERPLYLLLWGPASYDYKNRMGKNSPGVPSYESSASIDLLTTYVSDDFFGFLDDGEDINSELTRNSLDLGIGRIPATDLTSAETFIAKLKGYYSPTTRGEWRNEITLVADDEDYNLHLRDAEALSSIITDTNNRFQKKKIYLDAYPQESDAAGSRYPAVNQAVSEGMQKGTLIWNYSGHGGFRRLAEEVVLDQAVVDGWQQNGRLPLFITATCDFAPFDNPANASLGQYLLLKPGAGAIGLMTTTRLVFAYSNRIMNGHCLSAMLQRDTDGHYPTLGEAIRKAKNATSLGSQDLLNTLKFTLLGDPAIRLAFPELEVQTLSVNGKNVSGGADTIGALQEVRVEGEILAPDGQRKTDFNGIAYVQVLDKPRTIETLANDPGSIQEGFGMQDQFLFKGRASVKNGHFSFAFVVPKDISYASGNATIRYYAMDSLHDAQGVFDQLPIAGSLPPKTDREGPRMEAWLNDTNFKEGGMTGESPLLLVHLADSSGINILGNGIGHDISLVLDDGTRNPIVLNAFFETDTDTYQSGSLQFRLTALKDGVHTIRIKAWDVLNNSSDYRLSFRVENSATIRIESVVAWPNPFHSGVRFGINHNQGMKPLAAMVELFSLNGQKVKTIYGTIIGSGNRSYIEWNGNDEKGNPVPSGIYVFRMLVSNGSGGKAMLVKKLIRL